MGSDHFRKPSIDAFEWMISYQIDMDGAVSPFFSKLTRQKLLGNNFQFWNLSAFLIVFSALVNHCQSLFTSIDKR